jgi:lipoprotein-anchoring transpeptidase ErfK/SrfK
MLVAGMAACARAHVDPSLADGDARAIAKEGNAGAGGNENEDEGSGSGAGEGTTSASDVARATSGAAAGADAGAPADGPTLYAFAVQAPIFSASEWPPKDPGKADEERRGVVRLGYLRKGEHVPVKPGMIAKSNCAEGWFELAPPSTGFVCGKFATTDEHHKELKLAPHVPYMDRDLPYEYGLNLTPGTPLYRRIPLKSERRDNEKTLAIGKGVKTSDVAKKLQENGEALPAYLKDSGDAKPTVRFDDLKGESNLIAMRMLKGFYLSLDRKVDARSGMFWHTASGFMAPKDHLIVHEPKTEFEGVVLNAPDEKRKLPLAFVVGTKARTCDVDGDAEGKKVRRGDKIERFTILSLTGKKQTVDDRVYYETDKGFFVRDIDVAVVSLPKVPSDVTNGEHWIDVDLSSQALVAFEGDKPVYATVVSTGRHNADPEKDHRTVEGSFRIREKHITTTMDDDGASDGTYRIEDVPWVMYFEKSFALHGAFWHSSFGREKSHGCVNLTPHDARRLFLWAGPSLPEGWHGVKATKENPGTRVIVHK